MSLHVGPPWSGIGLAWDSRADGARNRRGVSRGMCGVTWPRPLRSPVSLHRPAHDGRMKRRPCLGYEHERAFDRPLLPYGQGAVADPTRNTKERASRHHAAPVPVFGEASPYSMTLML